MKKNHSHFSRNILLGLSVFITVFTTILFTSCNEQSKSGSGSQTQKAAAPGTESKDYTMNCLMLTRAQIQTWVDSGWTRPSDPGRVLKLVLQFYTTDAGSNISNMTLIAYPGMTVDNVKPGGRQILAIDTTCTPAAISGTVIYANNEISLGNLGIFKADGTLNDFDYVRFTPAQSINVQPYLNFRIELVKQGAIEPFSGGEETTWPCPTFCY